MRPAPRPPLHTPNTSQADVNRGGCVLAGGVQTMGVWRVGWVRSQRHCGRRTPKQERIQPARHTQPEGTEALAWAAKT